jgi:steroid delta-isomerase-like uncharacterized protein
MTPDQVRRFVERHVDAYEARDPQLLAADHAPTGTVESPSAGQQVNPAQIAGAYERWFAAFPDLDLQIENLVADTDQAAAFVRVTGTHRGDFMGLPATGKHIEFPVVLLLQFQDNLIVHERRVYDFSSVLIQLGLLKVKPS